MKEAGFIPKRRLEGIRRGPREALHRFTRRARTGRRSLSGAIEQGRSVCLDRPANGRAQRGHLPPSRDALYL